jgi:hypothetical protein
MRAAIKLDDQTRAMANEVGDVRPKRRLLAKVRAFNRQPSQFMPKRQLRRRQSFSKPSSLSCSSPRLEMRGAPRTRKIAAHLQRS